jgi:hypothetical protein
MIYPRIFVISTRQICSKRRISAAFPAPALAFGAFGT